MTFQPTTILVGKLVIYQCVKKYMQVMAITFARDVRARGRPVGFVHDVTFLIAFRRHSHRCRIHALHLLTFLATVFFPGGVDS